MAGVSFFAGSKKQAMKRKPSAEPLRPDELARLRELLRAPVVEDSLDAGEVARRIGLKPRAVLDMIRRRVAFTGAFKPAHNRVRIPVSDVAAFIESRRVVPQEDER